MSTQPFSPKRKQKTAEERATEAKFFSISDDKKEANRLFKAHILAMISTYRNHMKVTKKVYSGKAKSQAQWPNGKTVEKKDIKAMESDFAELLKQMIKYRKYANMRAPRVGVSAAQYAPKLAAVPGVGPGGVAAISKAIPNFFQEALAQGRLVGPQGQKPVITNLLTNNYTTNKELTSLFIIYVYANNLQNTQPGQSRYLNVASDSLFTKHFGPTLNTLEHQAPKMNKKGELGKQFSRNEFTFINLQQIIAVNTISSTNLTEDEFTKATQLKPQLQAETDAVAVIKAAWDEQRKPMKLQAKQQQQKAAQARKKQTVQVRSTVQPTIRVMSQ